MAGKKRSVRPRILRQKDKWGDDRKEQISLGMGTGEYRELLRDSQGVEEGDFVKEDPVLDAGEDRRPDEAQVVKTEPDHVAELAEDLREAGRAGSAQAAAVEQRKYRRQMSKSTQVGDLREEAMAAAEETPGTDDDRKAAGIRSADDIPDPIYDDGVSQDEFIPRSMRHIFGE